MNIRHDAQNAAFTSTDGNNVDILKVEGQTKKVAIGDIISGNTTEIESDGTIKFNGNATVYEDINASLASGKIGGANQPSWTSFTTNSNAYTFAINDYIDLGTVEIPHSYKNGSILELHLHGASNGVDTTDRRIAFQLFYMYAVNPQSGASVFSAEQSLTGEYIIPANSSDKRAFYISFGSINDANMTIGSQFKMRVKRITASTGTAPTNNPFLGQVGIHFISDTIGSREINIK